MFVKEIIRINFNNWINFRFYNRQKFFVPDSVPLPIRTFIMHLVILYIRIKISHYPLTLVKNLTYVLAVLLHVFKRDIFKYSCMIERISLNFLLFQGKYGDLDSSCISYGPCQTPTLSFCVDRHDKIQSFQSELYWHLTIKVNLLVNSTNIQIFLLDQTYER